VTFNPVKVIFISKGCQKVYGYNQEDFYGNPDLWSDVIIEEDNKVVEDIYEQIKTGETVFCKYRIRNKDGRVCWLGSKIFPTLDKDGKLVRIDGINTDISKRKINESNLIEANNQAEQSNKELIRTLNHFNRAQKIAHVGSWTLKFADKDAIWSDEACRIYGLLPNDNKQSYESWLSFIHPDDLEWVKMEISNSLETLTNTSFNHRIVLRDRTVKFINSVRMFELDEEGNAIGMYGIWFDITESKKAETDIIAKNIELEKINKELDRFVYSISHELRSPLTSVMGLLNIFKEEKSEERNREYIDMISRSVYKMDETLREILDYSRNSRNAITDEEIDLNILIKDIFNSNQYLENEITFKKRLNIVNKEPFYADKARLKVVLNNIISNAIKYRKKNYYNSFIKIDAIVNREKLILEIEDNGIGIHEKYVKGLGGMFFRATTEASGSGLGLYITKECVEKLNGSFSIQSEFGLGTKIRIEIPNHLKEII
jgi:PAS domain S-box-containing protein